MQRLDVCGDQFLVESGEPGWPSLLPSSHKFHHNLHSPLDYYRPLIMHVYPQPKNDQMHTYPQPKIDQMHIYPQPKTDQMRIYPQPKTDQTHINQQWTISDRQWPLRLRARGTGPSELGRQAQVPPS